MINHSPVIRAATLGLAAAMLVGLPAVSCADEEIDETRAVAQDAKIEISNMSGSVLVTGWDRPEIEVRGTLGEGTDGLEIEGTKERLRVRVVIPKRARHVEDTHLKIRLPASCRLEVGTVSADVAVEGLTGELTLESVSGDLELIVEAKELEAGTVSGQIELQGGASELVLGSVSGDITLSGIPPAMQVDLEAETVSGDLQIEGATFSSCRLESVSGWVDFRGSLTADGDYTFNSHSGDVTLRLAGEVQGRFEISTFSGDIDSDFGPQRSRRRSRFTGGSELHFEVGSATADVRVETFSGDVVLESH